MAKRRPQDRLVRPDHVLSEHREALDLAVQQEILEQVSRDQLGKQDHLVGQDHKAILGRPDLLDQT